MLKVECESCKAPYQVDERRVPPTGLKMRCPKCGHTFLVTDPSKGAPPAAAGGAAPAPAPASAPKAKQTMVGVGAFGAGKAPPMPPKPGMAPPVIPPLAGGGIPSFDDGLELPAVKPAAPKAKPAAAAPAPPPAPAPAPPQIAPGGLPGLDDLDLPSLASDAGLPAPAFRPAAKPAPAPAPAAASPPAPPPFNFEVDLPSVPGFGDLPSPKAGGGADLPMAKGGGGFGSIDLPSAKGGVFGDLPSPKGGGFGDLPSPKGGFADLPMVQNDLPQIGGSLPMVAGGNLPAVAGGNLPSVAGGNLPMPRGGGGFGEIDLPSVQNDLPQPMGAQAHMPMPVGDERLLPGRAGAGPAPVAFGELDLPLVGGIGAGPPSAVGGPKPDAVSFGELDLPADPSLIGSSPSNPHAGGAPGGMSFGEVDLGGAGGAGPSASIPPMGPPPATSAGTFAFQEASLEGGSGPSQAPPVGTRARPDYDRAPSKVPKILAALVAVIVVGGAALQFTPLGAFGYVYIGDKLHSSDYAKQAAEMGVKTREKLALDTYASATAASDEVAEARRRSPRSRPLSAYAAFVEFANQTRFGANPERGAKAKTFISDIPPGETAPYLAAANAAQEAAAGEWEKAKASIAAAQAKEPKDGIQMDLTILRGEVALAERDYATALTSFTEATKTQNTARAQFGLARTYYAMKQLSKAKPAVDAVLAASPQHAGGRTLRALLTWEMQRDDGAAMKDLSSVLDANARKTEGPNEISTALAAKGWIMLARDRATDARAAFDEAVKIDNRNVTALVGQGEVLYADNRFTEALTRFDEAVTKDPAGIPATIGAAKTKVALERLADAKAQLSAARAKHPKDMGLAMWLARTEEALGNKKGAEKLYNDAVDLTDPQNPDAIQAYTAFATFLVKQDRVSEAQAKLEQARQKLPDSASLHRAFGEVATTQGKWDDAVAHFKAALEKNPNDLGTQFRLGVAYRSMNNLDAASKQFDNIVAIDPAYPNIAIERGLLFERSGDIQKALEQFQSAYEKAPNDVDLKLRVGAAYITVGNIEKGLPLLEQVKSQRPNSPEANHFIGRAYLKQGGLEAASAMRFLQRAVDLDPNRAEYHLYVAWAANESTPAQLGLARTHVDKALALDKALADAYWQRGVVSLREGALADAMKDLKKALELKPSRHEAHAALAEVYGQKNETANAMAEWQRAIAGDDKVPSWHYQYGRLLFDKGNNAEAAKHLGFAVEAGKKAQPRPGWLGKAAFEAGESMKKSGQKPQACEAFQLYWELKSPTDPDTRDALRGMKELGCAPER
ncbi:MAG: zinc-ribbon domain-containing protein [Deltaproteobacteria bacterium]|nr:zinc-ribbon domain-containing protein [Deltaproteobacteria bacterium]